jgi:hypothetical protein
LALPLAATLDDELWRRAEARREALMLTGATEDERLLMPLALSLARLMAQRDAKGEGESHGSV